MHDDNFDILISAPFTVLLFAALVTAFLVFAGRYNKTEQASVDSAYRKEAVTGTVEEMADESKSYITGSAVLNEILSFPDDVTVRVNNTVINNLTAPTGDDYITYAKKYGTELLETQISMMSSYKRDAVLDDEGKLSGVEYTIAY